MGGAGDRILRAIHETRTRVEREQAGQTSDGWTRTIADSERRELVTHELLACARKAKAARIYTLNHRHFIALAPDLAQAIVSPS